MGEVLAFYPSVHVDYVTMLFGNLPENKKH